MKDRVRLGIVGCGAVVQGNYSKALPLLRGVQVTAVSDLDDAAAARAASLLGATVMPIQRLLREVDVVVVATPPRPHLNLVSQALGQVSVVICEKPFAPTESDAREMVARAAATNSRLYVGHIRRVFPAVRAARAYVATGALGRVVSVDASEGGRFSWKSESGYVAEDPAGGVLFDTGSHTVDTALFVSGLDAEVPEISISSVGRDRAEPSHDFRADFTLHYGESDILFNLLLSRRRQLANRVRIVCERGTVDVPVGPRRRFRVTTQGGSMVLMGDYGPADFDYYFAEEFRRIVFRVDDDDFSATKFVGLSRILQTLGEAENAR